MDAVRIAAAIVDVEGCGHLVDRGAVLDRRVAAGVTTMAGSRAVRLVVNTLCFVPYVLVMTVQPQSAGLGCLLLVLMTAWGFFGFRALLHSFAGFLGFGIHAGLGTWSKVFFFGSIACGLLGFLVIPVLIVRDLAGLFFSRRVSATNRGRNESSRLGVSLDGRRHF